jgi:hypothetical protein
MKVGTQDSRERICQRSNQLVRTVPVVNGPDTFSRKSVSTTKGPWRVAAPFPNQTGVRDETTTQHFVRNCSRAQTIAHFETCSPSDITRLEPASMGSFAPHSHSIINKPSKLLIYKGSATASALFTVTFTVNLI